MVFLLSFSEKPLDSHFLDKVEMPVIHSRTGDDRRKASSYRRAFGGTVPGGQDIFETVK